MFAPSLACAQPPAEIKAKGREIRMIAWAPIERPLTCGASPAAPALSLSTTQLSSYKEESPGDNLEIFTPVEAADGKIQNLLYAAAPWPDTGSRVLGVLGPGADEKNPRGKLFLMPDSLKLYPEHSARVLNLTPGALTVKVGDKETKLSSRGEFVVPYHSDHKSLKLAVSMPDQEKGWKQVLTTSLTTARHYRSLVILRPNPNPLPGEDPNWPYLLEVLDQISPLPPEIPRPAPQPVKTSVPDETKNLPDPPQSEQPSPKTGAP